MARTPVIAGNWKMHMTVPEALELVRGILPTCSGKSGVEVILAPPFTALSAVAEAVKGTGIGVAAQNMHWEPKGAYTGEVSAAMLVDAGCTHVIIGHSERRQYFAETDESVNRKLAAALSVGLVPIVCVGETLDERERGDQFKVIERQLDGGLKDIGPKQMAGTILAYEPVWAIGTGKTASPEQAQDVHAFIRGWLTRVHGEGIADAVRIQYGGSVKPDNVADLMSRADIDGALVGGAALKADSFAALVNFK
ncbi:MAG: triose-phosphate isomerase [Nitrospirae bacterium]|nr:triose-phosphate isomerase [Nitrospirota bacterium]